MFKHILLPIDGSPLSENAVNYGVSLAKSVGAQVTVIFVTVPLSAFTSYPGTWVPDDYADEIDKWANETLARASGRLKAADIQHTAIKVTHEQPFRAILEAANTGGCDLILMASHGRRGLSAVVLGSETVKVLTHSTIPVLVHRAKP